MKEILNVILNNLVDNKEDIEIVVKRTSYKF